MFILYLYEREREGERGREDIRGEIRVKDTCKHFNDHLLCGALQGGYIRNQVFHSQQNLTQISSSLHC